MVVPNSAQALSVVWKWCRMTSSIPQDAGGTYALLVMLRGPVAGAQNQSLETYGFREVGKRSCINTESAAL